jgi:hypothetical protein
VELLLAKEGPVLTFSDAADKQGHPPPSPGDGSGRRGESDRWAPKMSRTKLEG